MPHKKVNLKIIARGKNKVYQLDYRLPSGKRKRETYYNKQDAYQVRTEIERRLTSQLTGIEPLEERNIGLEPLIDEYLKKKTSLRENTVLRYNDYKKRIIYFFEKEFPFAFSNVRGIESRYFREMIRLLLIGDDKLNWRPWKKKTINDLIAFMRSVFKYAVEKKYIRDDIMKDIELFKISEKAEPHYYDDMQMEQLLKHSDPLWAPIFKFLSLTGLRRGELINLRWEDVRIDSNKAQIIIQSHEDFQTKTGGARIIPLSPKAIEIIESMKGRNEKYVFVNKINQKIHPNTILNQMKTALKKANLQGNLKSLRHSFASKLARKGVRRETIAKLLGHNDINTTAVYEHLSPNYLKTEMNRVDQADNFLDEVKTVAIG